MRVCSCWTVDFFFKFDLVEISFMFLCARILFLYTLALLSYFPNSYMYQNSV